MESLSDFFNLIFTVENPIVLSILFTIIIFIVIFFIFKYLIYPLQKHHFKEKKELELKKAKATALFAELAPDPLIRINNNGIITEANSAAFRLIFNKKIIGEKLSDQFPMLSFDIAEVIEKELIFEKSEKIGKYFFEITIRGSLAENAVLIYFHDLTERKIAEEKLNYSRNQLKNLSIHLNEKLEDERQRIGRDLHDVIGQNLLLMKMNLNEEEDSNFSKLGNIIDSTITDLRSIMYDLKPKILEEMGLSFAINSLIVKVKENTKIEGSLDVIGANERLDEKLELFIFRIIQESLNNIIKHSRAKNFNIQYILKEKSINIIISDDGIGFDVNKIENGMGLLNIKERVENYKGTLKIDSSPNEGTSIFINLPQNS